MPVYLARTAQIRDIVLGDGHLDGVHVILLLGEVHGVLFVSRRGGSLLDWRLPNQNL